VIELAPEAEARIRAWEHEHVDAPVEHAAVFDRTTGELLSEARGTYGTVHAISCVGCVSVHTHPSGSPPSNGDFDLGATKAYWEWRVVARQKGQLVRYRFQGQPQIHPILAALLPSPVEAFIVDHWPDVPDVADQRDPQWPRRQEWHDLVEQAFTWAATNYGFHYRKELDD
jgi:hypothetical protein